MIVSWYGLGCLELSSKEAQGEARVITDPFVSEGGLRLPRTLEAHVVTVSHAAPEANAVASVLGKPFVINTPGEYEVGGAFIYAILAPRKDGSAHMILRLEMEGIHLAYLGAIDRPLSEEEVKALADIDVLFVPVGGGIVLDSEKAVEVMQTIEPRLVVPIFYGTSHGLREATASGFLKEAGAVKFEETTKLKFTKGSLPEEETGFVVLNRE